MRCCVLSLALVGLRGVFGEDCSQTGTCAAPSDDPAMIQVARMSLPSKKSVMNSKPFMSSPGRTLVGSEQGRIVINEDGVENTYYLPGAETLDDGKTVKYTPPYRFYLMKTPTTDYSNADNFYKPYFPGKTFSVDINFGRDGASCGCNLNFYLVDMPVESEGQDHDHYCDAQCFPGLGCCAEFDMNEGNMDVQQVTNHACTGSYGGMGHPEWACHKWGDPEAKTDTHNFGIGPSYTIDSSKPFTFSQRFDVNNGDFTFTTTMTQGDSTVTLPMGPGSSELNAMLQVIERGMAFVTGYWFAPDMNWMDGAECGSGPEHCNKHPAYISNWRLTSNDGVNPAPAPAPAPSPQPSPPAPVPTPSNGHCCWGGGCSSCNDDPTNWCNQNADRCGQCSGEWCSR